MTELDNIIKRSLARFVDAITRDEWSGRREREAICLYVLAHLQHEVKPDTVLFDVRQLGIEMPVRQIDPRKQKAISKGEGNPKSEVAKDMMIWPAPQMTTWTREGRSHFAPLVIMEWKFGRVSPFEYDVRWREEDSSEHTECVG